MSVLASAGVVGVAVGFAAQRSLETLLAGIQLSITQPIRIGDAVELQKECGFVEDIRLSYVVIRLWDGRRLIVPTPRFLAEPVVNLTKGAENLIGTVDWRVDFSVPVHLMREAFERIVTNEPKWDGKVKTIEVTDMEEKTVTLRGLVSARSPSDLWSLRVAVREQLVEWLRQHQSGKRQENGKPHESGNVPSREQAIAALRPSGVARGGPTMSGPGQAPKSSVSGARGA
jgi:small-conductance mechanosensitive channel